MFSNVFCLNFARHSIRFDKMRLHKISIKDFGLFYKFVSDNNFIKLLIKFHIYIGSSATTALKNQARGKINFIAAKQKQISDKVSSRTRRRGKVCNRFLLSKFIIKSMLLLSSNTKFMFVYNLFVCLQS